MGADVKPSLSNLKKGNQYIKYPSKKINNVLLNIFRKKAASLTIRYLSSEKLIALPTANKKEGNTRSVGVKPCHVACSKGCLLYTSPSPRDRTRSRMPSSA